MGKRRHVFSRDARDAFNVHPRSILVDRNVSFVDAPVDHWGNIAGSAEVSHERPRGLAAASDRGPNEHLEVNRSGPFFGQTKGARSRFDYWMPEDGLLTQVEVGEDMPEWVRRVSAGERLPRSIL